MKLVDLLGVLGSHMYPLWIQSDDIDTDRYEDATTAMLEQFPNMECTVVNMTIDGNGEVVIEIRKEN